MPLPTKPLTLASGLTYNFAITQGPAQIPYVEMLKYKASWGREISSTRYLLCRWEDQYLFKSDMLGTSIYQNPTTAGGVQTNIHRQPPEQHPEVPWMFADHCEMTDGLGVPAQDHSDLAKALSSGVDFSAASLAKGGPLVAGPSNMVAFNLAAFEVTYKPRNYYIYTDTKTPGANGELGRYVYVRFKPQSETQIIPGTSFKFVGDGVQILEPIARTFPITELHYIWYQVPAVPSAAIEASVGTCNVAAFDTDFYNWPAQTLLMIPPDVSEPYRTGNGDFVYDIDYAFSYKRKTHNAIYRKKVSQGPDPVGAPGFDTIVAVADGTSVVTPTSDFNQLFLLP